MTYSFTYNNIEVFIDTAKLTISFINPPIKGVFSRYHCPTFTVNSSNQTITVVIFTSVTDVDGTVIPQTTTKKVERVYSNSTLNSIGIGVFDYFYNLSPVNGKSFGEITDLAKLNNQLEEMTEIFGAKIPCFNPYNNWSFYHPLELVYTKVDESGEDLEDGEIEININNTFNAIDLEYSIDGGSTWQSQNRFTSLSPGLYTIMTRDRTELTPFTKQIEILEFTEEIE